jgi:hypothetical protein
MPVEIYKGSEQLDELKSFLDTEDVKNDLGISLFEKDFNGNLTDTENEYGVMIQDPYNLMTNFLPQIIISLEEEDIVDYQFNSAETSTVYRVYYAMTYTKDEPYLQTMYEKLRYIARYLIGSFRTCQDTYFKMTLPKIERNNEINEYYQQKDMKIAVGRISFQLHHKGAYRED